MSEKLTDQSVLTPDGLEGLSGLKDFGACLPRRPMARDLTIPLNAIGDVALLALPRGTTPRELRLIVRYIETLLLSESSRA